MNDVQCSSSVRGWRDVDRTYLSWVAGRGSAAMSGVGRRQKGKREKPKFLTKCGRRKTNGTAVEHERSKYRTVPKRKWRRRVYWGKRRKSVAAWKTRCGHDDRYVRIPRLCARGHQRPVSAATAVVVPGCCRISVCGASVVGLTGWKSDTGPAEERRRRWRQ